MGVLLFWLFTIYKSYGGTASISKFGNHNAMMTGWYNLILAAKLV